MHDQEFQDIIIAIRSGGHSEQEIAVDTLVRKLTPEILSYCSLLTSNSSVSEWDVAQESWARVIPRVSAIQDKNHLVAALKVTALHYWRDTLRRGPQYETLDHADVPLENKTAVTALLDAEQTQAVRSMIEGELSPRDQAVLYLFCDLRWMHAKIAAAFDIPEPTVRSIVRRSKEKFQKWQDTFTG